MCRDGTNGGDPQSATGVSRGLSGVASGCGTRRLTGLCHLQFCASKCDPGPIGEIVTCQVQRHTWSTCCIVQELWIEDLQLLQKGSPRSTERGNPRLPGLSFCSHARGSLNFELQRRPLTCLQHMHSQQNGADDTCS